MRRWLCAVVAAAAATLFAFPALAQGNEATIGFELAVEGTPPEEAAFFAQYLADGATVQLANPDGDGVFAGEMSGGTPDAGFRIVQGTGVEQSMTGVYPGQPLQIIERFPAPEGAATLISSVSFEVEADGGAAGDTVSVTGIVEKPQMTTYMYGTHAVTDEATGTSYALAGESVNLDEYVGRQATVSGQLVPGYEDGQVEGGPPLVEVASVEAAGGGRQETAVVFEVTINGGVPQGASLRVQSESVPDGEICGTDGKAACRGGGERERLEVKMPAGERFGYKILAGRDGSSKAVVAQGSNVAEDGTIVRATYEFPKATVGAGSGGEDVKNGDGEADEADADRAARVSDEAKRAIDPDRNPLPVTGGAALLVLLSGAALAIAGYAIRRATR